MGLDFTEISDGELFESFCADLLRSLGFEIVIPPARGPDSGVDFHARSPVDTKLGLSSFWLVQCKHYAVSRRAVGIDDLTGPPIADLLAARGAQVYLLITSTVASQSLQSHLHALQERCGRLITVWGATDLEARIQAAGDANLVQRYFPRSGAQLRDSTLLPADLAGWNTIRTTLYARALTDITDNIGRKYIPDLYVSRSGAEATVNAFCAAATSSGSLVESIASLCTQLSTVVRETAALSSRVKGSKAVSEPYPLEDGTIVLSKARLEEAQDEVSKAINRIDSLPPLSELVDALHEAATLANPSTNVHAPHRAHFYSLLSLVSARSDELLGGTNSLLKQLAAFQKKAGVWKKAIERERQDRLTVTHQRLSKTVHSVLSSLSESHALCEQLLRQINLLTEQRQSLGQALNPALAIIDRAGRGKTNLVCDLVRRYGEKQPTIFVAAKALPASAGEPIADYIAERLRPLGFKSGQPLDLLAQVAHLNDSGVLIVIDGINENVDPFAFAGKLHTFLRSVAFLPIRVVITCREEYWRAFADIAALVAKTLQGDLGYFSDDERRQAVRKYFRHYGIDTWLDSEPARALRDPLLLRFFCEAYASRGESIGARVHHIRLKALFDEYRRVKYEELVRRNPRWRFVEAVSDYVDRIARAILVNRSTTLDRKQLAKTLPAEDLNSVESLYARLLDEDIVIEQRFVSQSGAIVTSFTYEAFMEYALGAIVAQDHAAHSPAPARYVDQWMEKYKTFSNQAGVLGFFLAFVFERDREAFEAMAPSMLRSTNDTYLFALRIALDNIAPEELNGTATGILLDRLASSPGINGGAFSAMDAFRILLRCPPDLAPVFSAVLASRQFDMKPRWFEWAGVMEHFGQSDTNLMWQSMELRFLQSGQLFERLPASHVRRLHAWCADDETRMRTSTAKLVIPKLLGLWTQRGEELEQGRWGGMDCRAKALADFFALLSTRLRS